MFGRVQAQTRAIRAASTAMGEYAARAAAIGMDGEPAARALPGFLSAGAVRQLDEDVRLDMKELNEHLTDTTEVLADIADHWDLADGATAVEFGEIAEALGREGEQA